ncbi:MAG: stage II sporulation protein R [Lachnospiraceae bacterium]|nr:stage II sporulation protein R [Lachnospiraceae bacterium]
MTERKNKKAARRMVIVPFCMVCFLIMILFAGSRIAWKQKKSSQQQTRQLEISKNVLRFHIRAVSDKEEDQRLKLKVKDHVLVYLQELLGDCKSKQSCMEIVENNRKQIEEIARAVCLSEGENIKVKVKLTREEFPLKQYGDMIFPCGVYDALRVDLGEAKGKNWWCMMYPSLCTAGGAIEEVPQKAKEEFENNLTEDTYASLFLNQVNREKTGQTKAGEKKKVMHIKWKLVEKLKKFF